MAGEHGFWEKVEKTEGCWTWTGSLGATGYGQYSPAKRRNVRAHRFAYEQLVGQVSAGLELDHTCSNRACVNPGHLEPVTHAENLRRGRSYWAERTHCKNGHAYDEANTHQPSDGGRRTCRACHRAVSKAYTARKRAA